jgi:uncharacterized protein YciI
MRFAALLNPGRAWIEGKSVHEQDRAVMLAHLHAMRAKFEEGSVLFGGPFRSDDGGIVLIEAPSRADARSILDADPAVGAGILDYSLFDVRPYFDAISGEAWRPA